MIDTHQETHDADAFITTQRDQLVFSCRRGRERDLVVITSLHDLTLAAQYADRVLLLDRGHTVAEGAPLDVLTEHILTSVFGAWL